MDGQLTIYDVIVDGTTEEETAAEELFTPNGRQRCPHCRKRLHAFAGRLLCVNAYCAGGSR